jgi:hypothetical protein
MKKIYVKPATEVYEVELQNMIADSGTTSLGISKDGSADDSEVGSNVRRWGSLW